MNLLVRIVQRLDSLNRTMQVLLTVVLLSTLGTLDYLTGHEAFFAVFYLFPIGFVTWFVGQRWGLAFSAFAAAVWALANIAAGATYTQPWIHAWNTLTRLSVFLVITVLLAALRAAHELERRLARTDQLTGAVNRRSFWEAAESELARCRRFRHPFTVIYADLDNFKSVNDQQGHSAGDALLRGVVDAMARETRAVDVVARLGGDEFAVLLPETGTESGHVVADRVRRSLLRTMAEHGWPVSVSLGVVTCLDPPETLDELLQRADDLMYAVKKGGKNGVRHEVLRATLVAESVADGESAPPPDRA